MLFLGVSWERETGCHAYPPSRPRSCLPVISTIVQAVNDVIQDWGRHSPRKMSITSIFSAQFIALSPRSHVSPDKLSSLPLSLLDAGTTAAKTRTFPPSTSRDPLSCLLDSAVSLNASPLSIPFFYFKCSNCSSSVTCRLSPTFTSLTLPFAPVLFRRPGRPYLKERG